MPDPAQTQAAIEALKSKAAVAPMVEDPTENEFYRLRTQEALSRDFIRRHLAAAEDPNTNYFAALAHRAIANLAKPINHADRVFKEAEAKSLEEIPTQTPEVYGPPEPYGPPAPEQAPVVRYLPKNDDRGGPSWF